MAKDTLFEFPFEYVEVEGLGLLFYPIIQLEIKTVFGWKKFDFLVDTGADVTTLPSTVLPLLGLDLKKLPKNSTFGVGGIEVAVRDAAISLRLGTDEFKVEAAITEDDGSTFLLGKKDVFEKRFSLKLDSVRKTTILERN